MKVLSADKLSKSFGGLQALRSVDLEIEAGECRAIIGPNGAGKTTLFHLLSGTLPTSSGTILFQGEDITRSPCHVRAMKGLARTFQITSLFPSLTTMQNVILAVQAVHGSKFVMHRPATSSQQTMDRVQQVLEEGGLWNKRNVPVRYLSYGEQRQLEVMLALAGQPKVLLLDEPTAGLSEAERGTMTSLFRDLRGKVTIVLVSHDIDVAFAVADGISVLHMGELLTEGTPAAVRQDARVSQIYLGDESESAHA
ncbi:MAG: ABC transporter ATP-binding protein [Chloroflexi bacterium]|nr:ABC transporter ATP-binding protein [Chloroflexota bacterium]